MRRRETTISLSDSGARRSASVSQDLGIADYEKTIHAIIDTVQAHHKHTDPQFILRAFHFSREAHKNQLRKSGAPYIEHCVETARELAELRMDLVTVAAGLLHDVVEDTGVTIEEVRENFGEEVAQLVDGVTKISGLQFTSHEEEQAEYFRKLLFAISKDLRVILIKFADRLHNMRTLHFLPRKQAERIALETREIYAPLAHRFGMANLQWELEDLALKILDPEAYEDLFQKLAQEKIKSEQLFKAIIDPIQRELNEKGIQGEITGRFKSIYSIYRKMKERGKPFHEIYDIFAIRIIVNTVDECYIALGIVQNLFNPVDNRYKDYIAKPKVNLYKSIHTTVVGPEGRMVEVQIRTWDMHKVAEIGIAAHWKYKEGRKESDALDYYSAWIREIIDWQKDVLDPKDYLEILKTDLFHNEVFVFTPKGDLLKLPQGATALDFAFAIHSEVGLHCLGAKVNNRIVPIHTVLQNGDTVEILTSIHQKPHQDWLKFVRTSKAKTKIKQWLKIAQYQEAVHLGEEMLTNGLKRLKVQISSKALRDLPKQFGKTDLESLYAELGRGDLSLQKVLGVLVPQIPSQEIQSFEKTASPKRVAVEGIRVQGMDHFLIQFAKCCHPVPGDSIIGFITQGKGISIHRRDCLNWLKLSVEMPEKIIDVAWDVDKDRAFQVQLRLMASSRKDFLKEVADSLLRVNTNILKLDLRTENTLIDASILIEVRDLEHLTSVIQRLQKIKGTISVTRDGGVHE